MTTLSSIYNGVPGEGAATTVSAGATLKASKKRSTKAGAQ